MRVTAGQRADIRAIAAWLYQNVSTVTDTRQGEAFAALIVTARTYDRTKPVNGNRLSGVEFDIPAPDTLTAS